MNLIPSRNAAEIGFLLAVAFMTAAVNLDWKHYVRYFVGRTPEFGSIRVRVLRWAFLVAFVGSFGQLWLAAFSTPRVEQELPATIIVTAGVLLAFAIIDCLFRFLWR